MAGDRSPAVTRWVAAVAAFSSFAVVATVASLSDRAPAHLNAFAHDLAELARRIEMALGIDVADRSDIPFDASELAHLFGWAAGMVLVGLVVHRWWMVPLAAAALFGGSVAIEVGQELLSTNRAFDQADIGANGAGITAGLVIVTLVRGGWRLVKELRLEPVPARV